ncbi:probable inactive receptor kinase At5g58300 [Oryza brachyantha]|uniref:probable inactive receptor kinase At5g58300 n=1 Tax=Oryza brachyantha TaxID=4533 RepID=UPI001AD9C268|nr:probable inactive receptor kinase At5g58300 [Oryza brachyantha]
MGWWQVLGTAVLVAAACCSRGVRGEDADEVRASVVGFLRTLAGGDGDRAVQELGWNASVAPCGPPAPWLGVHCTGDGRIEKIVLEGWGLSGTINATMLCAARALRVLSLQDNALHGGLPADISGCSGLTHIYVGANRLSGSLPPSLVRLTHLHVLNVSKNDFSGEIPAGLSKLGLARFCGNDNHFNGTIPEFELSRFEDFSVANNNLTGSIPRDVGIFGNDSFSGNSDGMCGQPSFAPCPTSSGENDGKRRGVHTIVMCLGYVLFGAGTAAFVLYMLCSKKRRHKLGRKPGGAGGKGAFSSSKATTTHTPSATPSKSAYSLPMSEERSATATAAAAAARAPSASLVVLQRSATATAAATPPSAAAVAAKSLRFEDLLKSPAELLGRGRFGSAYKVVVPGGAALAVKRVKDAAVGEEEEEEFRRRMERVGKARHPAVLPPLAFYCAMQEKLVVYEFQSNGSLAKLLHGSVESSRTALDWPARLHIAAKIADGMAFMHDALRGDGANANLSFSEEDEASAFDGGAVAHGNLKASNVLFTAAMEPRISEYGVTAPPQSSAPSDAAALNADVRAYGVLLLELLTGKATADGAELARWVTSVIREEWTAEVFDRVMLSAGGAGDDVASEQRMVRLLQIAMRCVDASSPPPTMREVAGMVNAICEEDGRSVSSEARARHGRTPRN